MQRDTGDINFPIWFIGDSEPERWKPYLRYPFDSIHPIRHNIITSILDVTQDYIYRSNRKRIDSNKIYIRNAIADVNTRPKSNYKNWNSDVVTEIQIFKSLYNKHKPTFTFTFGAFAYEFVRRSLDKPPHKFAHWSTEQLGKEFYSIITNPFNPLFIIPLLHRSIAGKYLLESHSKYCGNYGTKYKNNYFDYVGTEISKLLLIHADNMPIWI